MTEYVDETPLWRHLLDCIDWYDSERDAKYGEPATPEEATLVRAIDHFARRALEVIHDPSGLPQLIDDAVPSDAWESVERRAATLMDFEYVNEQAESAAAYEVVSRLSGLSKRVRVALLATLLLQQASPSLTARNYLGHVTRLYLAGFQTEVIVLCGAVLEAAVRDRIPDALLAAKGRRPKFRHAGDYSLAQRIAFAAEDDILKAEDRERLWSILNARNDAVHVHPGTAPNAGMAVLETAYLLGQIQPVG